MRTINEIIIHCSATPEGKSYTVEDIDSWHKARGFSEIGYHYVIYLDGTVHKGRDIAKAGAHCKGHNSKSVGICYIGGVDSNNKAKDTRTEAQKEALIELIKELLISYPTITKITGHNNYAAKDCPSFDATTEYSNLINSL